jgi:hypothetical protein
MTTPTGPLCFVLMPFGSKPLYPSGPMADFDLIYEAAIRPGVEDAGLTPLRADHEELGGTIHKLMFERLLWCPYAVADLTTSNGNVFYELGIRHAVRPSTTLLLCAAGSPLPFDVQSSRTVRYDVGAASGLPDASAQWLRTTIAHQLTTLRELQKRKRTTDSPLFELVTAWNPELPETPPAFDSHSNAVEEIKQNLRDLRASASGGGPGRARALQQLPDLTDAILADPVVEMSVLLALVRTYPAVGDWDGMVELYERLPPAARDNVVVRQQVAMAYNRLAERAEGAARGSGAADRRRAIDLLTELEASQGPTSEACGLLGRIHKAQWREDRAAGREKPAHAHLQAAIHEYVRGFEIDLRDFYPGVNAVTLLDIEGSPESLAAKARLLPVVEFALDAAARRTTPDYWFWATRVEVAVLKDDFDEVATCLGKALAAGVEAWQLTSTADNLRLIADSRRERGAQVGQLVEVIQDLVVTATGS